ncbi:hydantoinase/oxoprolinase family protein [Microbacterium sp. 18062]|uniref:hydantoinase/oxoprolinase family protein n=1 Tax=Microbacterium sp. 18062 TaxID=2681410 RepID=UPI00135BA92D|nr:hydantoinase/oxoprolinase family protein [Microbacterium sp. 18062]
MKFRVGVDIGGTYTDAVAVSSEGEVRTAKALSTPGALADGVLNAVGLLGVPPDGIEAFIHGTTAGLNAFLERRGARMALVTTRGFRDVYELGRASRPDMYNLRYVAPAPLIARRDVFEIDERLGADGRVVQPLDAGAVRELAVRLAAEYEAVAVVLLHAYRNPVHERAVRDILADVAPDLAVVISNETAPEWREYERTSTTAISGYVAPIVRGYLDELEGRLRGVGFEGDVKVMQSNGGTMPISQARGNAIQTLFSGPVGGTMAGVAIADDLGIDRLICVDMGGTSFDVSLVIDHMADIAVHSEIEGHPLLSPSVVMHTIGAGGGSVAHVMGGALRVGPRSAGSVPGPASYGRGGIEPTVTDANVSLGRLPRVALLGGSLTLDEAAAASALAAVGDALGLSVERTALGVIEVADAAMANAIREITVARGIDPRDFALVAFGGAGPLHATSLADELEIERVIVPANPGVLSAWGMVHTDTRYDLVRSLWSELSRLDAGELEAAIEGLEQRGRELLADDGFAVDEMSLLPVLDLRYAGQEYTLSVPLGAAHDVDAARAAFDDEHQERFGHNNPSEDVEMVAVRLVATGVTARPAAAAVAAEAEPVVLGEQEVRFAGSSVMTPVVDRGTIPAGRVVVGPAIVLESGCTILVPPGWAATPSAAGHLILERNAS